VATLHIHTPHSRVASPHHLPLFAIITTLCWLLLWALLLGSFKWRRDCRTEDVFGQRQGVPIPILADNFCASAFAIQWHKLAGSAVAMDMQRYPQSAATIASESLIPLWLLSSLWLLFLSRNVNRQLSHHNLQYILCTNEQPCYRYKPK